MTEGDGKMISNQDKINNVFTKNNYYLSTSVISPKQNHEIELGTIISKCDSAASHHYWRNQDKEVQNKEVLSDI